MRRPHFELTPLARAFLIVAASLIVYLPALRAGFIWDDAEMLTENPLIHAGNGLARIWFGGEAPDFFPLTLTSFWLEWRLWGANAFGYHAVNVVLHSVNAVLLWRVLLRMKMPGAFAAALLFAVHPVNAASVAWIAERKNTLSMAFFLASVLACLRDESASHRRFYWLALLSFLCALLSKTSVVMLPVVLLGLAWWRHAAVTRRDVQRLAPFFVASLILGVVTIAFQHRDFAADSPQDPWMLRIARVGWIVGFYAMKTLFPFHLCLVYPRWNLDLHSPLTYLPTLALAGFLAVLFCIRKTWARNVLLGAGYFGVMLLPVSGLISMTFFNQAWVADWWQYAAIPGLLALVAAACATWARRHENVRAAAIFAIVLCGLGSLTWLQARTYKSLEINCRHALACNPLAWGIRNNLARELAATGRPEEALALYREGLRLEPGQRLTLESMGKTLIGLGRHGEALPFCREVVKLQPKYASGHNSLAAALGGLSRYDEAAAEFREAVQLAPARIDYRLNLIHLLALTGDFDGAVAETETAIRVAKITGQTHQLQSLSDTLQATKQARDRAQPGAR